MILKTGITGFSAYNDSAINESRIKDFKQICYQDLREYRVADFNFDLVGKNFFIASLERQTTRIFVLSNAFYPYLAFSLTSEPFNLNFINCNHNLHDKDYRMLQPEQLNCLIKPDDLTELNPEELKQIQYWKPNKIGEVIFNFWN